MPARCGGPDRTHCRDPRNWGTCVQNSLALAAATFSHYIQHAVRAAEGHSAKRQCVPPWLPKQNTRQCFARIATAGTQRTLVVAQTLCNRVSCLVTDKKICNLSLRLSWWRQWPLLPLCALLTPPTARPRAPLAPLPAPGPVSDSILSTRYLRLLW